MPEDDVIKEGRRFSLRLKGYNYAWPGAYFVTVCTQNRLFLLELPEVKGMVERTWRKLEERFSNVELDQFVVMPNHIHGIITITSQATGEHMGSPLPTVLQWFKTMTTNEYIRGVKEQDWPAFPGRLWQRNYYEHIVRDDEELNAVRQYIWSNPEQWESDSENPNRKEGSLA